MKKINFKIKNEKFWIFIKQEVIDSIFNFAINKVDFKESGGYLFVDKIKDTNEFICKKITHPQKKDIVSEDFFKMSWKHKRMSRKITRKNPYLYEVGFYHTHPKNFGCNPSSYDLEIFCKKSTNYKISLFIISIENKMKCLIYSFGKKIKEVKWHLQQ